MKNQRIIQRKDKNNKNVNNNKKKKKKKTTKITVDKKNVKKTTTTKKKKKKVLLKKKRFIKQESTIDNSGRVPICYVCRKEFKENEITYACKHCKKKPNHFNCLRTHPRYGLIHDHCIQENIEAGKSWLKRSLSLGTTEYY